jgi:N-acyl-D-amino-acid deacylase
VCEGPEEDVVARLRDPRTADRCRDYVEHPTNFLLRLGGFDSFFVAHSRAYPELVGRSLEQVSNVMRLDHTETILSLAAADERDFAGVLIRHIFATRQDLDTLLADPYCSVGSDGAVASTDGLLGEFVMNRSSFGYAPRFIEEYALKRRLITLEEAVRKLTSLPADSAQLRDRGRLAPGMAADLVVMDVDNLRDNSTDDAPQAYPSGINMVVVNGQVVFEDGVHTQRVPGQILRI